MTYFVDYRTAKSILEQRRARSMARYEATQRYVDSFRLPRSRPNGEVIELVFPEGCDITELGA